MSATTDFPALLQAFFAGRLMAQLGASPHTIAAYRDTFRLLFQYAREQLGRPPSALRIEDLDAPFICAFLDHLETARGNGARTRNARLAAIRSFFSYAAYLLPEHTSLVRRVLAIPGKRYERAVVEHLDGGEVRALLGAPDRGTHAGRRDYALLLVAVQTGLRVSELAGLRCRDVRTGAGAHLRCLGKGRKERCVPLGPAATVVNRWLKERKAGPDDPLFPNRRGGQLSTDGIRFILAKHIDNARRRCPSLKEKKVSPHVLRHTAAMRLLQAGADDSTIALWLGHERLETVHIYAEADLMAKQEILARAAAPNARTKRFRPEDALLAFLNGL